MAKAKKKNELVPVHRELIALHDWENLSEIVSANIGDQPIGSGSLEAIKVPSGGAPVFVTENEIDGIETVKEFEGLLCWFSDVRTWWSTAIDEGGGGDLPSCTSRDMTRGQGSNTGNEDDNGSHVCRECPNNRFGPNSVDTNNWCKETREMFVLRLDKPEVIFPSVLRAPPTSLKPIKRYMMGLAARGIPYFAALHKFSLEPATNAAGINYSTIRISFERRLEDEEIEALKGYAANMKETFGNQNGAA